MPIGQAESKKQKSRTIEHLTLHELEKLNTVVVELHLRRQCLGEKIPPAIKKIARVLQAEFPQVGTAA